MNNPTLKVYDIPYAFRALLDESVDEVTGEFTEAAREELDALVRHSTESILNLACSVREMEEEAKAIEEIADRAYARRDALLRRSGRYLDVLLAAMEATGEKRLADPRIEVRVRQNPPLVHVYAEDEIPMEYLRVIPERFEPDNTRLRVALKTGQSVPGCELVCTARLEIR